MSTLHPAGMSLGYDGYRYQPDPRDVPETRLLSQRTSIAHTSHRCDCCGRTIEPGQRYHRESFLYDGEFHVHKSHDRC